MGKYHGAGWVGRDAIGFRKVVLVLITWCKVDLEDSVCLGHWAGHFPVAQDQPAGDLSVGVGP